MRTVGHNHKYIRRIFGIFGRGINKYAVISGAYLRFWPTLVMLPVCRRAVENVIRQEWSNRVIHVAHERLAHTFEHVV
jgi:hypothetical protein